MSVPANPANRMGPNPQPAPRESRIYTFAELDAISVEMSKAYRTLPEGIAVALSDLPEATRVALNDKRRLAERDGWRRLLDEASSDV